MLANYGFKLRHIFLPFLLLSASFLLVFGFVYWLLVLRLGLLDLNSETRYWLFFALSGGLAFLALRGPLRLLRRGADDRWITLFYLAPSLMLTLAALFAADYLTQATGELTALNTPAEVSRRPLARFYTIRQVYAHKDGASIYPQVTPAGKDNEKLRLDLYVVCPLLAAAPDSARREAVLWLGWHEVEFISARLSQSEKESRYQQFMQKSEVAYQNADFSRFRYLAQATAADDKAEFQQAARRSRFYHGQVAPQVVLPRTEPFARRIQASLHQLTWTLLAGLGLYLVMLVFPGISSLEVLRRNDPTATPQPGLWAELKPYVWPRPGYTLTPLLVGANAAIYLGMVFAGLGIMNFRAHDLLPWGALYGPALAAGEWWRLVSSTFLHGGLLHVLYNLVALGLIGWALERTIGTGRVALVYGLGGLGAGLASVWWQPEIISVGASGAIFALFGAALLLAFSRRVPAESRGILLIFTVAYGLIGLALGFLVPGTDNAAHIGGLLTGLAVGSLLLLTLPAQPAGAA